MKSFLCRIAIVIGIGIVLLLGLSRVLSRDQQGDVSFALVCSVDGNADSGWNLKVTETGLCRFNNRQAGFSVVEDAVAQLVRDGKKATLTASEDGKNSWAAEISSEGISIDGKQSSLADLLGKLRSDALPEDFAATKAVTVKDVLAANPAMPTKSRVSFPELSFEEAFPGDSYQKMFGDMGDIGDDVHYNITSFKEAPLYDGSYPIPDKWKPWIPDLKTLPPVEQRLPVNPGVVVGPDSPGRYSPGRAWRRVADATTDWNRKMAAESFVRFDPAGRLQPCLAYRWDVSDDNRIFTFYLRKGHKWSDGTPFTSHDITYVCNTIIGSFYWATSPAWMMESDGFVEMSVQDVLDWPALKKALSDTENSAIARIVAEIGTDGLKESLAGLPDTGKPSKLQAASFINRLNTLLRDESFYREEAFADIDIDSDIKHLLDEVGYSRLDKAHRMQAEFFLQRKDLMKRAVEDREAMTSGEIGRMNVMLFRASLPGIVTEPIRQRVIVEAVDDGTGDDSHIVRFTFPRPNSIILEKTGTFMFYRGIFEMPRKYYRNYIPDGVYNIADCDVYDWQRFGEYLLAQVDAEGVNPSKKLWNLFDESTQKMLRENPPTNEWSQENKQALLEAINKALADKSYFDEDSWAATDLELRWNNLIANGYSMINTRVLKTQLSELLWRKDARRRFNEDKDLSDEEIVHLNVDMFRAAYSTAAGQEGLIGVNKEQALDRAARNDPKKYTTWIARAQKRLLDVTGYDNHVPTLRPWFPISDRIDPEFNVLRNPYYYKVDAEGRQLPYIDVIESKKQVEESNVQLSMSSGNVDFQARTITFDHYTFLKSREKYGNYRLLLWANDYTGEVNFYTYYQHKDPRMEKLLSDRRFRHALSLALDRQEIIDIVFHGLGKPAQCSFPEGSPYYNEKLAKAYVEHDPDEANRLLDELGLDKKDSSGMRLLPDGSPLSLNLDTREWLPLPALMLACEQWRKVGLNVTMKIRSGSLITRIEDMKLTEIGTMKEGGNYIGPMAIGAFVPIHMAESPQWKLWSKYMMTRGRNGDAPPEWLLKVYQQWNDVVESTSDEEKFAAWQTLIDWAADELPRIGITTSPGKLIYVRNDFKNVPDMALAGWVAHEPSNCCPEGFYFTSDEPELAEQSEQPEQ